MVNILAAREACTGFDIRRIYLVFTENNPADRFTKVIDNCALNSLLSIGVDYSLVEQWIIRSFLVEQSS